MAHKPPVNILLHRFPLPLDAGASETSSFDCWDDLTSFNHMITLVIAQPMFWISILSSCLIECKYMRTANSAPSIPQNVPARDAFMYAQFVRFVLVLLPCRLKSRINSSIHLHFSLRKPSFSRTVLSGSAPNVSADNRSSNRIRDINPPKL